MRVKITKTGFALARLLRHSDRGAALPMVVLVFMLSFILIGAFTIALVGSAQVTAMSKSSLQSQAAAEAGIAAARVALAQTADSGANFCTNPPEVNGNDPDYTVQLACNDPASPTSLTITSTGSAADGNQTVLQAIMPVTPGASGPQSQRQRSLTVAGGSIGTLIPVSGDPNIEFTLVQPSGDYSCGNWNAKVITGDLFVMNGNVTLETANCKVLGTVWASGTVSVNGGVVGEDVKAVGTRQSQLGNGTIGGSFTARGSIRQWGNNVVPGGIYPNTSVSMPANLPSSVWLEYALNEAEWQAKGYVKGTVTGCGANDNLVSKVNAATVPTYFICPSAFNMWNAFTLSPKTDIAIVNLGGSVANMTVTSGNGQTHLLSLITNDRNLNSNSPTCTTPAETLNMHGGVTVHENMRMAIYTPCQLSLSTSTIRGSIVAGSMNSYGSGNQLITYDVGLPGFSLAADGEGGFIEPGGGGGGVPTLPDGLSTKPTEQRTIS